MAPLIISIEGNIGSGKSTLLKNLQDKFQDRNYVFVKEPVDLWEYVTDEEGKTILVVTHEQEVANMCNRIITLKDGVIMTDIKSK